ncbi:HAMP domain-containing sensor histidine kinase [Pseudonocardia sp. NPDC049635]|uniref:sensor histidine kinase n=1 Tax=Pseudonocardia sp. NPDC049635 TaxID=3155506 RepID=UPI0033F8BB48
MTSTDTRRVTRASTRDRRPAVTSAPTTRRLVVPARLRIVGWFLLLLVIVQFSVGLAVRNLMQADALERARDGLEQETTEFLRVADSGRDPITGEPTVDAVQLLDGHLRRQHADRGEVMLAITADGRTLTQPERPMTAQDRTARLDPILATGQDAGRLDLPGGPVMWSSVRVLGAGDEPVATFLVIAELAPFWERADAVTRTVLVVSGAGLALAAFASWVVAGQILRPVNEIRRAAARITHEDLTRRIEVAGHDDIAALAAQFNAMLDRLDSAFRTQREFLDDASHELRTPITIVRGNLEFLEDDDPAERAEVVRLCNGELDRMSRIVEDLLLLAKAEQPDFVVRERTDLLELTTDVAAKLQRLGDRVWRIDALPEGEADIDPQRITQALVQLAQNAVQHTGPGDRISLGVTTSATGVAFRVTDTGSGITPEDAEAIFGRFSRGAASGGSRGEHTGAGLGLAIVTAIAEAHGGHVELESSPGHGSTFTIRVPATVVAPEGADTWTTS